MCCDLAAVAATQQRGDYVEALANAARLKVERPLPNGAAAFRGETKMRLLERAEALLGRSSRRAPGASLAVVAAPFVCWLGLALALSAAQAQDGERPRRDDEPREVNRERDPESRERERSPEGREREGQREGREREGRERGPGDLGREGQREGRERSPEGRERDRGPCGFPFRDLRRHERINPKV